MVEARSGFLAFLGITLTFMGFAAMILLEDLSHQFFRQEIGPWISLSIALVFVGVLVIAFWYVSRLRSE